MLATPASLTPLAELSGAVDEVLDAAALAPLPAAVHSAEVAVNLHGSGPESHRVLLATRPRRLIAFAADAGGEVGRVPGPAWDAGEPEVARWCRLLAESGVPADPRDLDLARPPWPAPPGAEGATLVHPGSLVAAKRWPVDRWGAVARAEREAGRDVLVTGGPGERALGDAVAAAAGLPSTAVLAGRTDLRTLAAAVAVAGRVVSGDTGIAHLATALGTPSVVLFGPVAPALWGPPPDRPWHRVLWAGRTDGIDGDGPSPGMLAIEVDDVVGALAALPEAPDVAQKRNR